MKQVDVSGERSGKADLIRDRVNCITEFAPISESCGGKPKLIFFGPLFDAANLPTSTISRMRDKQLQPLVLSAVRG